MSADTVLTLTQALQLVGLMPCFFVVVFLLSRLHSDTLAFVPACYFLALASAFALPLLDIFFPFGEHRLLSGALLFGESVLVAFAFLMILQFITDRVPPFPYWLVLAIPLVGGELAAVLTNFDWGKVIGNSQTAALIGLAVLVANVVLRIMTTGPVGGRDE